MSGKMQVSKDYNRNVLRFQVPLSHPALDPTHSVLCDGGTGDVMGARPTQARHTSRVAGGTGVVSRPEQVPQWVWCVGEMVTIPSGPAHSAQMVAAANRAIAEAINAGFVHHANALRNIGSAAFETSKRSGGDTKALKSGFLEYAKGAQEQDARMREARLLNAPQRTQRTAWRAVLPGSPSPTSHIVLRLFLCVQVSSWWGK